MNRLLEFVESEEYLRLDLHEASLPAIVTMLVESLSCERSWAYQKLGFSRDGVLRQAYRLPDGTRTDLVLMALLKPEWEARKG